MKVSQRNNVFCDMMPCSPIQICHDCGLGRRGTCHLHCWGKRLMKHLPSKKKL